VMAQPKPGRLPNKCGCGVAVGTFLEPSRRAHRVGAAVAVSALVVEVSDGQGDRT
jgi:hypothetical protein